jgi:hypothetical protein
VIAPNSAFGKRIIVAAWPSATPIKPPSKTPRDRRAPVAEFATFNGF